MRRRDFVTGLALSGGTALLGVRPGRAAAEAPPETTQIRMVQIPGLYVAPQYVTEDLLRLEGFTDVRYASSISSDTTSTAYSSWPGTRAI